MVSINLFPFENKTIPAFPNDSPIARHLLMGSPGFWGSIRSELVMKIVSWACFHNFPNDPPAQDHLTESAGFWASIRSRLKIVSGPSFTSSPSTNPPKNSSGRFKQFYEKCLASISLPSIKIQSEQVIHAVSLAFAIATVTTSVLLFLFYLVPTLELAAVSAVGVGFIIFGFCVLGMQLGSVPSLFIYFLVKSILTAIF
ncbi:MAG: hypothetical protein WC371_02640 [Parachlamydiales bacterium]|jgi:hypothetical protein